MKGWHLSKNIGEIDLTFGGREAQAEGGVNKKALKADQQGMQSGRSGVNKEEGERSLDLGSSKEYFA